MQRRAPQTSDIDDETLFAKVERGDVEAFTAVYNKYHKLLYALAYRYLMSSAMLTLIMFKVSGDSEELA